MRPTTSVPPVACRSSRARSCRGWGGPSALEPPEGMDKLIETLGIKSASGFVGVADPASENEVVVGDHVYACGTAIGPAEVPESVTQARAVVSKILQSRK